MTTRIHPFTVSTPAGTLDSAPLDTPLSFQEGRVTRIEIKIPPGPSGLVGFRVAHSGQSVLPPFGDGWFITDNDNLDWDLDNFPQGNAWSLVTYNLDIYSHDLQVWIHVDDDAAPVAIAVTPLSISQLAPSEDDDE